MFGNGSTYHHFIHVRDLSEALVLAATRAEAVGRSYIIADDHAISIEAMLQRPDPARPDTMPIILLTHRVWERAMDEALDAIAQLPSVRGPITRIRVHTDGAC